MATGTATRNRDRTAPLKGTAFTNGDLQRLLPYLKLASLMRTVASAWPTKGGMRVEGTDVKLAAKIDGMDYVLTLSDNLPIIRGCKDGDEDRVLRFIIQHLEQASRPPNGPGA